MLEILNTRTGATYWTETRAQFEAAFADNPHVVIIRELGGAVASFVGDSAPVAAEAPAEAPVAETPPVAAPDPAGQP